jgi:hypothetical protein
MALQGMDKKFFVLWKWWLCIAARAFVEASTTGTEKKLKDGCVAGILFTNPWCHCMGIRKPRKPALSSWCSIMLVPGAPLFG